MIERHLPLVRSIARRFTGRGESFEDLVQVGTVALIAAVDRCERGREGQFTSYAAVCVEGEIRRHLRDRCDPLRIPRHLHGDAALMAKLRAPVAIDGDDELIAGTEVVESDSIGISRALVASAARSLDARERLVVALRYFLDLSQAEIGAAVGLSQVQVSRLLDRALGKMRRGLAEPATASFETARGRIGSDGRECRPAVHGERAQRPPAAPDAAGAARRAGAGGGTRGDLPEQVDRDATLPVAHGGHAGGGL
jgi:RNA polymerase sigma factor (sigma-70 family)